MTRSKVVLFVVILTLSTILGFHVQNTINRFKGYEEKIEAMQTLYEEQEKALNEQTERAEVYYNRIIELQTEINELKAENIILEESLQELEEVLSWERRVVELTAYAPLDPNAVKGVCYSGNPAITSSGEPSTPNVSVAMGSSIPFGTEVFITGHGFRTVHDRGGAVSDNHLDMMVDTRSEAFRIGRKPVVVYINK